MTEPQAGCGQTAYSRQVLEPAGAVRLSVDEVVHDGCGRYGLDYPKNTYFEKEAPVVAELQERLVELVAEGVDVVWDHGLRPCKNRPGRLWQPPIDRPQSGLRSAMQRLRGGQAEQLRCWPARRTPIRRRPAASMPDRPTYTTEYERLSRQPGFIAFQLLKAVARPLA